LVHLSLAADSAKKNDPRQDPFGAQTPLPDRIKHAGTIMELKSRQEGNAVILCPEGRIDHTHADAFKAAIDPHVAACTRDGKALVLDFSGITFISSIGLRALMIAVKQVKAQGGRMMLAALTPLVLEVFTISRFDMLFEIHPSVEAASAALSSKGAAP
jgi:anti-anti-sigma factor